MKTLEKINKRIENAEKARVKQKEAETKVLDDIRTAYPAFNYPDPSLWASPSQAKYFLHLLDSAEMDEAIEFREYCMRWTRDAEYWTTEKAKYIATCIYEQLGGNRFASMTGASNLASHLQGALSLRFKMNPKVNYMKIVLNALDTYDVEFGRIHGDTYSIVSMHYGIYNDGLQDLFKHETGLDTHL